MQNWFNDLPIEATRVLLPVYLLAAVLLIVLATPVIGWRGRMRYRLGRLGLLAGIGALAGWLLVYWVVDVQDVFGAPASDVIRGAATAGGAGIGIALGDLVRSRWWRKVLAVVGVLVFAASAGLMINRDVAYYPKLGDVYGVTGVGSLALDPVHGDRRSLANWRPPADMPSSGIVSTARIPGTVSKFQARDAWIYLPPAARVKNPPRLPVMIAFPGQPGGPSDVFLAGNMQARLDALAAKHKGIAPIVVVPDQLGSYDANPMCLNSPLGQVKTYVLVDVRDWVLRNLPVSPSRTEWSVAGFSEGATCAVQFATEAPAVFSSFVAVSPELGPLNKSVAHTIKVAFKGNRAAYEAALPITVMRKVKHYRATRAVYSVGALDTRYGKDAGDLAVVSREVGMRVSYRVLPDLAHNWNTGAAGLDFGLQQLVSWWKLP